MSNDPTCEQRIDAQLAGRLDHIAKLQRLAAIDDEQDLRSALDLDAGLRDIMEDIGWAAADAADQPSGMAEDARQSLDELPLGVSASRIFRIDLSTGGPGDWLEVRCSGDTPAYEGGDGAYEIDGVSYHFNDWFDHAQRELRGDELATAEAFAREVVPELVE